MSLYLVYLEISKSVITLKFIKYFVFLSLVIFIWFSPLDCLIWCIILIDFLMLKNPWDLHFLGFSWYVLLLIFQYIFIIILIRILIHIISEIYLLLSFFEPSLSDFSIRDMFFSKNYMQSCLYFSLLWNNLCKLQNIVSVSF